MNKENRDWVKRKKWQQEYDAKKKAKGYWRSKAYREFRRKYRKTHSISKKRKEYQKLWKRKKREQYIELITELLTMLESGTISVGALGLSENSAKYLISLKPSSL